MVDAEVFGDLLGRILPLTVGELLSYRRVVIRSPDKQEKNKEKQEILFSSIHCPGVSLVIIFWGQFCLFLLNSGLTDPGS